MVEPQKGPQGILYITYGAKYVRAAIHSARTARKHNPGLLIHLFVDAACYEKFGLAKESGPFSSVGIIERPHRRSKVDYISQSPFERTLYLDSDTSVAGDIKDMFDVLDRFDVAACHAMHRNALRKEQVWREAIPNAFSQFNGGMLLYRRTPAVQAFLRDWGESYAASGHRHDQITLRELLWQSDLRVYVLPPEYNVRFIKYRFLWSNAEAVPIIYHLKQYHIGWGGWLWTRVRNGFFGLTNALVMPILRAVGIKDLRGKQREAKREARLNQGNKND